MEVKKKRGARNKSKMGYTGDKTPQKKVSRKSRGVREGGFKLWSEERENAVGGRVWGLLSLRGDFNGRNEKSKRRKKGGQGRVIK